MTGNADRSSMQHGPDANEVRESYLAYRSNVEALARDYPMLLQKHSGHWAAYYQGELITVDANQDAVIATLRERQIPLRDALIQYIVPKDVTLVV